MCGRFAISMTLAEQRRLLQAMGPDVDWNPSWNICPTTRIPVLLGGHRGRRIGAMRWGWNPSTIGGRLLINARGEEANEGWPMSGVLTSSSKATRHDKLRWKKSGSMGKTFFPTWTRYSSSAKSKSRPSSIVRQPGASSTLGHFVAQFAATDFDPMKIPKPLLLGLVHDGVRLFIGRDRQRLKILVWEGDGFWMAMRRLETTRLMPPGAWSGTGTTGIPMSPTEVAALLHEAVPRLQRR